MSNFEEIEKLPTLVYRTDDTEPNTADFLVVEDLEHMWVLPEIPEARHVTTSQDEVFNVRRRYDFCPPTDQISQSYFWVSYEGLKSVMAFQHASVKRVVEEGPPVFLHPWRLGTSRRAFTDQNWSVVMAKPDAMERSLDGAIEKAIQESGLTIEADANRSRLAVPDIERIWTPPNRWNPPMEPEEWWHETVKYMGEGPVRAFLVSGEGVTGRVKAIRETIRAIYDTNPHKKDGRSIAQRVRSLVHISDRTEELLRNASLLWSNDELQDAINGRAERVERNE